MSYNCINTLKEIFLKVDFLMCFFVLLINTRLIILAKVKSSVVEKLLPKTNFENFHVLRYYRIQKKLYRKKDDSIKKAKKKSWIVQQNIIYYQRILPIWEKTIVDFRIDSRLMRYKTNTKTLTWVNISSNYIKRRWKYINNEPIHKHATKWYGRGRFKINNTNYIKYI